MTKQELLENIESLFVPNNSGAISETEVKEVLLNILSRQPKVYMARMMQNDYHQLLLSPMVNDFGTDPMTQKMDTGLWDISFETNVLIENKTFISFFYQNIPNDSFDKLALVSFSEGMSGHNFFVRTGLIDKASGAFTASDDTIGLYTGAELLIKIEVFD